MLCKCFAVRRAFQGNSPSKGSKVRVCLGFWSKSKETGEVETCEKGRQGAGRYEGRDRMAGETP